MKHILIAGITALTIAISFSVNAETMTGKVLSRNGDQITLQQKDGTIKSLTITDNTTYRKKKIMKRNKVKKGHTMKKGESYYLPMVEENDWVEIVYTPTEENDLIMEDVTVYDD
jgi:hypothetical protein